MTPDELKQKLSDLYELINQVLPTDPEGELLAPPHQWRELNDLTREIAEATQKQADFWRRVAERD